VKIPVPLAQVWVSTGKGMGTAKNTHGLPMQNTSSHHGNILAPDLSLHQMGYKNTKSNASSIPTLTVTAINSSFNGSVSALKIMNSYTPASLKTARCLTFGTNLVVMGQALHDTFCQGF